MVIAQPVEDQFELSSGRSHRTDVAVAAAMSHLFSDRADVTGIGQAVEQGFPPRGARRSVMTATGLVVTDLSHLDVGLNRRGDFRRPVRFAVSSKPSRPARRQSVPPQVMRPYNHPSRLCAASSRASHNSMPGLQPARSRWASAAIWSAVSASATSRQPVGSHGCGQPGGNRRPGLGPGAGQAGAAGAGPRQDPASLTSENGGRPESSQDTPPIPEGWGILGKCSCFIVTIVAGVPTTSESLMHMY